LGDKVKENEDGYVARKGKIRIAYNILENSKGSPGSYKIQSARYRKAREVTERLAK
jgi:hypothetical protein